MDSASLLYSSHPAENCSIRNLSYRKTGSGRWRYTTIQLASRRENGRSSTYGGKMTENIVQAVARDCLAETLKRIDARGLQVVFHVHDEVIIDAPMETTVDEICDLMAEPIPWAPGLILKGAGFENDYYMKD